MWKLFWRKRSAHIFDVFVNSFVVFVACCSLRSSILRFRLAGYFSCSFPFKTRHKTHFSDSHEKAAFMFPQCFFPLYKMNSPMHFYTHINTILQLKYFGFLFSFFLFLFLFLKHHSYFALICVLPCKHNKTCNSGLNTRKGVHSIFV